MSREIKFRALHQNGDHYREIQFVDFIRRRYQFVETDYWCEGVNGEWPEGREPQQFTGLYDRDGKEVYCGDSAILGLDIEPSEIEEYRGSFGAWGRKGYENQYWRPICHLHANDIQVIGTIHDKEA